LFVGEEEEGEVQESRGVEDFVWYVSYVQELSSVIWD
jgi:hypothetical protein